MLLHGWHGTHHKHLRKRCGLFLTQPVPWPEWEELGWRETGGWQVGQEALARLEATSLSLARKRLSLDALVSPSPLTVCDPKLLPAPEICRSCSDGKEQKELKNSEGATSTRPGNILSTCQ